MPLDLGDTPTGTPPNAAKKAQIRAAIGLGLSVDVASAATAGAGTQGSPWTGWDTAITWADFTRYNFRSGYYAYATSPNFLLSGIELIGEPGTYIVHTGTGNAFTMDAGPTVGLLWIMNVRVENLCILGTQTALTGTVNFTNGSATITGNSSAFTSQVTVGDAITLYGGTASAASYIVTAIGSDTSLTVDRVVAGTATFSAATVTKSRCGIYLRGVRNGVFDRLSVKNVATAAIWTEACVTNSLRMFRSTYHEPAMDAQFACRPQYGIVFSGRGADWSTTWNVEEPVIEGMQIYGIWCKTDSYGHTFINGTSEANKGVGMQLDGPHNTIIGTDFEQNTGNDIVVNSNRNLFLGIYTNGTVTVGGSVGSNFFQGGYYQNVTIASGSYLNRWYGATVNGTFSDSGNATIYTAISGTNVRARPGIIQRFLTDKTAGTIDVNCLLNERLKINMSADCTINAPTNPADGDIIEYVFNNNSGSTKNITWNSVFASLTGATLPATVATAGPVYVRLEYSSYYSKWHPFSVIGS